jgi:hypothetical protein
MARKTKNQQMLDEMIGDNLGDNVEDSTQEEVEILSPPDNNLLSNELQSLMVDNFDDETKRDILLDKANKINELTTPVEIEIYNETDEKIPVKTVVQTSWGKPTHYARRNVQTLDYTTDNPNPPEGYINYNKGVYKCRPDKPIRN